MSEHQDSKVQDPKVEIETLNDDDLDSASGGEAQAEFASNSGTGSCPVYNSGTGSCS